MRQHEPSSVRRAISGVVTTITFILIGAFAPRITTAQAFEFTVNDKADEHDSNVGDVVCGTNSGTCTIRAALEEIAFWAPSCDIFDHVVVPGGRYLLTIPDQLSVVGCVHIAGTGANGKPNATVIDGNGGDGTIHSVRAQRPLYVNPGSSLLLTGVTVRKGHDHTGGGAIRNDGDLQIYSSLFAENSTHGLGGAILNRGNLWINETTFSQNISRPSVGFKAGGAIANSGGAASALLYNVTIERNFTDKTGTVGGGVLNTGGGVFSINNGTITANTAKTAGAGIYNGGTNSSGQYVDDGSVFQMWNTILARNVNTNNQSLGPDCAGNVNSFGYNILGIKESCTMTPNTGDQIGSFFFQVDPGLDGLANNGGPVPTRALLNGSPAIDAGNPTFADGACAETDSRLMDRPQDGPTGNNGTFDGTKVCDIGAFEYASPKITVGDKSIAEGDSGTKSLSFQIRLSFAHVETVTVVVSTADGTAKAGTDYTAVSKNVTFNAGQIAKTVAVPILGDTRSEPNESFTFTVSLLSGRARVTDGSAVGTITNDD